MSYPGSKAQNGVWHRIIGQMPPHSVYVEPFFGSGQVFWQKLPAKTNWLIDKNFSVIEKLGQRFRGSKSAELFKRPLYGQFTFQKGICFVAEGDSLKILPQLALPTDAVVYCDPPYVLDTRQGRLYYEHEMSDEDHSALLSALKALNCYVMISGYPSKLYDDALKDWRCIRYRTRTRGRTVTECLWCNFPEPTELHDWRFAGTNFRQRLYLSRLRRRWLAKLERMKPRQRGYVLNAIEENYFRPAG